MDPSISHQLNWRSRIRAWLALLRLPNLLTVPGDLLVGYAWAAGHLDQVPTALGVAIVAALFLYMSGLVFNDLADMEEDRKRRPQRPLPSGAISPRIALLVAAKLMSIAVLLCLFLDWHITLVGATLTTLILLYNLKAKAHPIAGPLCMGACRATSVLLGAAVASPANGHAAIPVAVIGLYIVIVTRLARRETEATVVRPPVIGLMLSALLPLQAGLCFAASAPGAGLLLLLLWPAFLLLSRRFAPS